MASALWRYEHTFLRRHLEILVKLERVCDIRLCVVLI